MVTPLYAALLAALLLALTVRVILLRHKHKVGLGDGGIEELRRAIRAQGNFAELVPMALLLMFILEQNGWAGWGGWVGHALGLMLLAGRLSHAYGVSGPETDFRPRVAGMALTMTVLALSALLCLWVFLITGI